MGVRAPLPLLDFLEVWLSLVECSVRDAEVASSNLLPSTKTNMKPHRGKIRGGALVLQRFRMDHVCQ